VNERRHSSIARRDFNDLFRDESGRISGSKIGTYAAQVLAGYAIYLNFDPLPTWDVLTVLFMVLIAPEAYKKAMAMRWGGQQIQAQPGASVTVTDSMTKKRTVQSDPAAGIPSHVPKEEGP
jgi:hypothetical protein